MPVLLKQIRNQLKQYRPGAPRSYPLQRVSKLESRAAPGINSVTYKAVVKGSGTRDYITFVQFFDVEFKENKDKKFFIPVSVGENLKFHSKHSVAKNRVSLKCSCDDFRFRFEKQLFDEKALIGRFRKYVRKTPPPVRPANAKNPNPIGKDFENPDDYLGFCKHIWSLLNALKGSDIVGEVNR